MPRENSNPKRDPGIPDWFVPVFFIGGAFGFIGVIFARLAASRVPDPMSGQTYQIYFAKSQSHWYLNHWQYVVYKVLTAPALCMVFLLLGIMLYKFCIQYWPWRRQ